MFRRIVNVVEVLALLGVAVFVVMLFANEPSTGTAAQTPGARLFAANCATCHGTDGAGAVGPQLSDGRVVQAFPAVAGEIAVVTDGRDGMPAFGGQLSAKQIAEVVDYTRKL
jgi:mono/diheme cytochrome c family protein